MSASRQERPGVAAACRAALGLACVAWIAWYAVLASLMATKLEMNDFGRFYYAAIAFREGRDMYAESPATPSASYFFQSGGQAPLQLWNLNPPHFHFAILPLTWLPPRAALAVWATASLAALAWSMRIVVAQLGVRLGPTGRRLAALGLLSFAGTGAVVVTAQSALLLLLPCTLMWAMARAGRWTGVGTLLGILASVKPFFGLFLLYLLVHRRYRAAARAVLVGSAIAGAGLGVFGFDAYQGWLGAVRSINWEWAAMNASLLGALSRWFTENPEFSAVAVLPRLVAPAWAIGTAVVGAVTLKATATEQSHERLVDRSFALILLASVLMSPLGWVYYLWSALGPLAAVAKAWRERPTGSRGSLRVMAVAAAGLCVPVAVATAFQPLSVATVSVGSATFWATVLLWLAVLSDRAPRVANAEVRAGEIHLSSA